MQLRLTDLRYPGIFARIRWGSAKVTCVYCGAVASKDGLRLHGKIPIQQYRCRKCDQTFNEYTGTMLEGASIDAVTLLAVHIWTGRPPEKRPTLRAMAQALDRSPETVRVWANDRLRARDHYGTLRRIPRAMIFSPSASSTLRVVAKEYDPVSRFELSVDAIQLSVTGCRRPDEPNSVSTVPSSQ
jgi:transposase-like protein